MTDLAFSSDASVLLSASWEREAIVWDGNSYEPIRFLEGPWDIAVVAAVASGDLVDPLRAAPNRLEVRLDFCSETVGWSPGTVRWLKCCPGSRTWVGASESNVIFLQLEGPHNWAAAQPNSVDTA